MEGWRRKNFNFKASLPLFISQLVLFEKAQFAGQAHEMSRDLADTTSLQLSPLISVKVVRGW